VTMRIPQFLAEHQIPFEPLIYPPAFSAQKRAKRLGVPGGQVLKSVLLAGPQGYLLAILPATRHIDTAKLEESLRGPVRLATTEEIREVFQDCEWGVVEPLGHLYGLKAILDDSIPPEASIILETHTHAEAIRMTCRDFERIERPQRLRFATTD
jgi:Ala-tRNA(Pro) deacylase